MFIKAYGPTNQYLGYSSSSWVTITSDVAELVAYFSERHDVTHVLVQVNGKIVKTVTADKFKYYNKAA
jgi:hypothetical protein